MFDIYYKVTEMGINMLIQALGKTVNGRRLKRTKAQFVKITQLSNLREGWAFRRRGLKVL